MQVNRMKTSYVKEKNVDNLQLVGSPCCSMDPGLANLAALSETNKTKQNTF